MLFRSGIKGLQLFHKPDIFILPLATLPRYSMTNLLDFLSKNHCSLTLQTKLSHIEREHQVLCIFEPKTGNNIRSFRRSTKDEFRQAMLNRCLPNQDSISFLPQSINFEASIVAFVDQYIADNPSLIQDSIHAVCQSIIENLMFYIKPHGSHYPTKKEQAVFLALIDAFVAKELAKATQ